VLPLLWGVPRQWLLWGAKPESEGPARVGPPCRTPFFTHHNRPGSRARVTAIVQDTQAGFIWLGTQSGLGSLGRLSLSAAMPPIPGRPGYPARTASFSRFISIDRGRLWIGNQRPAGLARYDTQRDSFTVAAGPSGRQRHRRFFNCRRRQKRAVGRNLRSGLNHVGRPTIPIKLTPLTTATS